MMGKGLFLDRDGVVNVDHGYVGAIENFDFQDGIFDLVRDAIGLGYRAVVVTNQAGIARGFYDQAAFASLTAWMLDRFAAAGAPLTDVLHCPFHREGVVPALVRDSHWRKPNPGMVQEAARRHGLDPARSVLIGDQPTDMAAAAAAGVAERWFLSPAPDAARRGGPAATRIIPDLIAARFALRETRGEIAKPI